MIKRVSYLSEASAKLLVPDQSVAMVSITERSREASLSGVEGWGALLRVHFSDAEYDEQMLARLKARGKVFDVEAKGFPSRRSSETIRAFLVRISDDPTITELVVHCHAGQRRSAAVAKFASEMYGASFDHSYSGYNRTVYALLRTPALYERPGPVDRLRDLLKAVKRAMGLGTASHGNVLKGE
jgi:predicted protein tyrosine phosphatase